MKKRIVALSMVFALALTAGCSKTAKNDETQNAGNDTTVETEASNDKAKEFLDGLSDVIAKANDLDDSIANDDLNQTEFNMKSQELYELWDGCLNDLWAVLTDTLSEDKMDKLTKEEQDWISEKEAAINKAGAEYEGGSIQPLIENMEGARRTKERVEELVKLVPGYENYDFDFGHDDVADDTADTNANTISDFLAGKIEFTVPDSYASDNSYIDATFNPGNTFDIDGMKSVLDLCESVYGIEPVISYAKLDSDVREAYVVSFEYAGEGETFTEFCIFSVNNGTLELNFAVDGWSRRYPDINDKGGINVGGSNGAGSHGSTIYVPDSNFKYVRLADLEENYLGYKFYTDDGEDKAINDVMDALDGGDNDVSSVPFTRVVVNGTSYYYYYSENITQDIVSYIDGIASGLGFIFDGKDKADAAMLDYAKTIGAEEAYKSNTSVEYTEYH